MRTSGNECPVCCRTQGVELNDIRSAIPLGLSFEDRTHSADAVFVRCSACGEFAVTDQDEVNLKSSRVRSAWNAAHVSALLREQTVRNLPRFWLRCGMDPYGLLQRTDLAAIDINELLTRWPRTIPQRLDRTLCNFAQSSKRAGVQLQLSFHDTSLAFSETADEAEYIIRALLEYNYLKRQNEVQGGLIAALTPDGWARFDKLTQGTSLPENPVFVAMWFGDADEKSNMDEAYLKAIQPAIGQAGYRATRVDMVEHNGWIMDKVLGDIRLAPFIVADFTGNRNGVYFEAGFARGLGIPVIHTCRQEHLDKAHFDTKQLNHVLWQTPDELREKLYNRIAGTIGMGPHKPSAK